MVLLAACSSTHVTSRPSGGGPSTAASPIASSRDTTQAAAAPSTASTTSSWPGYHATQTRTGAVTGPPLAGASLAWSASLGGAVYGQPLVGEGRIFAATENDRVVALDPASGALEWSVSLGSPLTNVQAVAGCGDIDPLGITSTPVLDAATGVLYAVGEVSAGGVVHHELEGIVAATGKVVMSEDVDPPLPAGESPVNLLQRAGLALGNGRVYVAYGGNDGDCGDYHGWVVGVAQTGAPHLVSFEVAADGEGGAVWESGGAPAIDASGDVYVTTGNANPDPPQGGPDPKLYTESVVKLSPTLTPLASYKDKIAGGDEDLATGNPVLLPDGDVFAVGKTDVGYLLRQSDLGQVAAIPGICGSDPDGGPAYDAATDTVVVPCKQGGEQFVNLATGTVGQKLSGANGAPIVVGQYLWALAYPSGSLFEYGPAGGIALQHLSVGAVPTFASPSAGDGLLLVGTRTGVAAVR
jgi:polyvinyl alcohol dehydrogenase (cytochrome)